MESRREKIHASLLVLFIALSTREARWYRLRAKDANDKYSLSFLCGVAQDRLDDLLVEGGFLQAYGKIFRVRDRDISLFLDASAVDTELVHSQVGGKREHFLRIGAFGGSPRFTASDQFALGKKAHERPDKAGISFRKSLNVPSETTPAGTTATVETTEKTTGETTEETAEKTNEPHTKEVAKATDDKTRGTTDETVEGTTEQTTEPTQRCTTKETTAEKTTEKASEKTTVGSIDKTAEVWMATSTSRLRG
jgi:hypothetical protein